MIDTLTQIPPDYSDPFALLLIGCSVAWVLWLLVFGDGSPWRDR